MAITVDYTPIAAAMQLGAQAGVGQRNQQQFQNDMAYSGQVLQAQRQSNDELSRQIQLSLQERGQQNQVNEFQQNQETERNRISAQNNLAQQQLAANSAYRNANLDLGNRKLDATSDYRDQSLDLRGQQLDSQNAARSATEQYRQQRIGQFDRGLGIQEGRANDAEANQLTSQQLRFQKALQAVSYNPNDPNQLMAQPSAQVPGAIAGREQEYTQYQSALNNIGRRMQSRQAQPQASGPVAPQAPAPQQQAAAPSQALSWNGDTLSNQTGQNVAGATTNNVPRPSAPGATLDQQTAMQILQVAGGDPNIARQLARSNGWNIP